MFSVSKPLYVDIECWNWWINNNAKLLKAIEKTFMPSTSISVVSLGNYHIKCASIWVWAVSPLIGKRFWVGCIRARNSEAFGKVCSFLLFCWILAFPPFLSRIYLFLHNHLAFYTCVRHWITFLLAFHYPFWLLLGLCLYGHLFVVVELELLCFSIPKRRRKKLELLLIWYHNCFNLWMF